MSKVPFSVAWQYHIRVQGKVTPRLYPNLSLHKNLTSGWVAHVIIVSAQSKELGFWV